MKTLLVVIILLPALAFAAVDTQYIPAWLDKVIGYGTAIVTAASAITSVTPNNKANAIVAVLKCVLDALALNFGYSKQER